MTTGTTQIYPEGLKKIVDGSVDVLNDTLKVILLDSSHAFNSAHTLLSDVSANELSTGLGYTQQDKELAGKTVTRDGTTISFQAYDPSWLVENSNLVADAAVVYDETASNTLLFSVIFSEQAVVPPGQNLLVEFSDQGIITLTT